MAIKSSRELINEMWPHLFAVPLEAETIAECGHRPLCIIAADVERDWEKVSPYARPYLEAMETLTTLEDSYGCDSARSVVLYFLSNANSWRGENARRLKAELRSIVAMPYGEKF